jgi:signal transduction histidine kinase
MGQGARIASRSDAERTIALARVALGCTSLFAVWLDPAEPARFAELTYTLHAIFVVYAVSVTALIWQRRGTRALPLITHVSDIVAFSIFQILTLGPSSPFFVYFIFSLFCAAIRWGWRGTLWTAGFVVTAYLVMTASMIRSSGPLEFEVNRAIIRTMYLLVSAALLVYLGRHEQRLREEIETLARWPATTGVDIVQASARVLRHAADIMGARRAIVVWETGEEPALNVARWSPNGGAYERRPPDEGSDLVDPERDGSTFVCAGAVSAGAPLLVAGRDGNGAAPPQLSLPPLLNEIQGAAGLSSAAFQTERVRGRVFFADLGTPGAEIVPLTDVVAREIGFSLDQLQLADQLREIAASEERIRVARDLHDGVLQSLTGIRLEIRAVAGTLDRTADSSRDRLFAIERALAIEQRELRMFIDALGPSAIRPDPATAATVPAKLEALRERMALEWKTPVTIRVTDQMRDVPLRLADAIPLMVHEAVVNALKHGNPSRVAVTVERQPHGIRVVVTDDGTGFSFKGHYDHAALAQMPSGPRSLLERIGSLGGTMSIDSTDAGSRVEMRLTL